jgi:ABC-2 type transport system permease protein
MYSSRRYSDGLPLDGFGRSVRWAFGVRGLAPSILSIHRRQTRVDISFDSLLDLRHRFFDTVQWRFSPRAVSGRPERRYLLFYCADQNPNSQPEKNKHSSSLLYYCLGVLLSRRLIIYREYAKDAKTIQPRSRQDTETGRRIQFREIEYSLSDLRVLASPWLAFSFPMNGLLHHLLLTLRLNFRSRMPVIYAYLVPVFFLIGFAAVFRGEKPAVLRELGQLLTISVLGGACFGMPTAMVGERERGIWRRYRLLPLAGGALVGSTMIARLVLVGSAAVLQIGLAMGIYQMPLPAHPVQMVIAFLFVAWAFLGFGLVIAMLAETVAAVQALGQAIFLPMILIGGVGVPLRALPEWAQGVAAFFPGRYAVEALDATITGTGLVNSVFSLMALFIIGTAAIVAGGNMFRWDAGRRLERRQWVWIGLALGAWAAVGVVAEVSGKSVVVISTSTNYQEITEAQINAITYDELQDDNSMVTPFIENPADPKIKNWMADFAVKLSTWAPAAEADPVQRARNLLSLAAVADVGRFQYEAEVPVVVFEKLKAEMAKNDLEQILASIILRPNDERVLTGIPELKIPEDGATVEESEVRKRSSDYAKKMLGRLLGKLG